MTHILIYEEMHPLRLPVSSRPSLASRRSHYISITFLLISFLSKVGIVGVKEFGGEKQLNA